MAVTIKDVAKEADVSISTVSKVMNNWSTISPETTARVRAVIDRLNYTPNTRAVSFARKNTKNIAFLTSLCQNEAYKNPHMFDIMCGIHKELSRNGYTVTLQDTSEEIRPGQTVQDVIAQKSYDGVVIHGSAMNAEAAGIVLREQFPHILIGHPSFRSNLCWIDTNHGLAGQYAARHLLEAGCTRPGFIGEQETDYISVQRKKGFVGGMYDFGYRIPEEHIGHTDSSIEQSYEAAERMLHCPCPPDAIVCENSRIAIGVFQAVRDAQIPVPSQLALLVFDSYPYAKLLKPRPTIIDTNVFEMGVQAGGFLVRKIRNPSLFEQSYTALPLIIQGETT